jgi:hypothetical protein
LLYLFQFSKTNLSIYFRVFTRLPVVSVRQPAALHPIYKLLLLQLMFCPVTMLSVILQRRPTASDFWNMNWPITEIPLPWHKCSNKLFGTCYLLIPLFLLWLKWECCSDTSHTPISLHSWRKETGLLHLTTRSIDKIIQHRWCMIECELWRILGIALTGEHWSRRSWRQTSTATLSATNPALFLAGTQTSLVRRWRWAVLNHKTARLDVRMFLYVLFWLLLIYQC